MSLGRALGGEFDGTVKAALKALLLEPAAWYAARLRASFNGLGASDRTVCRIIGGHDKAEIRQIASAYDDKYGVTLKSDIQRHCKGDYRRLAVAWLDLPDQLEQPSKLIELPRVEEPEEIAAGILIPEDDDEDEDDEDEEYDDGRSWRPSLSKALAR